VAESSYRIRRIELRDELVVDARWMILIITHANEPEEEIPKTPEVSGRHFIITTMKLAENLHAAAQPGPIAPWDILPLVDVPKPPRPAEFNPSAMQHAIAEARGISVKHADIIIARFGWSEQEVEHVDG
jgi:hypothetical protein